MHKLRYSHLLKLALILGASRGAFGQQSQTSREEPIHLEPDTLGVTSTVALSLGDAVQDLTVGRSGALYVLVGPHERVLRAGTRGQVTALPLAGIRRGDVSIHLGWIGDTLWVGGEETGEFRLFTDNGAIVRNTNVTTDSTSDGVYLRTGAVALLANGVGLVKVQAPATRVVSMDVLAQPLLRVSERGNTLDTLAWLATTNGVMALRNNEDPETGVVLFRQPFRDTPIIGVSRHGAIVVVVDRRISERPTPCYVLTAYSAKGKTIFQRSVTYSPVGISRRVRMAVTQRLAKLALQARAVFRNQADAEQAVVGALWVPPQYPPVDTVLVASDSSIWLRREADDDPAEWTVVSPSGAIIGEVAIPRHVKVLEISPPVLWGVRIRSGGVDQLVRFRLGVDYYQARRNALHGSAARLRPIDAQDRCY